MKAWIEKTLVSGRLGRENGDYSLGQALWSPQKGDGRGADIYANMRAVKKGDCVLHFIDNRIFSGLSLVEKEYDDTFVGLPGTEWADRPAYLIRLKDYIKLEQPIEREDLFANEKYREDLLKLCNQYTVFYTKNLTLRQGAYLTEAPEELVRILNDIYQEKTGQVLPYIGEEHKPPGKEEVLKEPLSYIELLKTKKQIILYGPPGTGKTYNTKKFTVTFIGGNGNE